MYVCKIGYSQQHEYIKGIAENGYTLIFLSE